MPANTVPQEELNAILSYVVPVLTGVTIANYYNPVTMTPVYPVNGDRIVELIIEAILSQRSPVERTYAEPMSAANLKDFYTDIARELNTAITDLTAVWTIVNAHAIALP